MTNGAGRMLRYDGPGGGPMQPGGCRDVRKVAGHTVNGEDRESGATVLKNRLHVPTAECNPGFVKRAGGEAFCPGAAAPVAVRRPTGGR